MIISELRVYDFRQFKSVDGAPGLKITFHKGLNALIGENDSGKTAVIDALIFISLLAKMRAQSSRSIVRFQILHRTKQRTLSNIFHSTKRRMALNIRLNFIIAHGKKDIKFIRNCVWAI